MLSQCCTRVIVIVISVALPTIHVKTDDSYSTIMITKMIMIIIKTLIK